MRQAFIVSPLRTPVGTFGGSLRSDGMCGCDLRPEEDRELLDVLAQPLDRASPCGGDDLARCDRVDVRRPCEVGRALHVLQRRIDRGEPALLEVVDPIGGVVVVERRDPPGSHPSLLVSRGSAAGGGL
jgi:hypothetical protein